MAPTATAAAFLATPASSTPTGSSDTSHTTPAAWKASATPWASTSEREHVLTSLLKRHDRIVGTALDRYLAGDLDPGVVTYLEREEGMPFGVDLVLRGARERLAPILMTTLAAGLALVPMVVFGEMSTGAENDIEVATNIARKMVKEYGMSGRLGPVALVAQN